MNITVILIEALIFALIFTAAVFASSHGDNKYSVNWINNYPPDIREEYYKTHEKPSETERSKKVILTKCAGLIMFTFLLFGCSVAAGAQTFLQGFLLAFGLMIWIGAYDTFFLDWVLFANMKIFRLEGTEHMDKEYHQKWFHLKGILFPGLVFALFPALIVGGMVALVR